MGYKCIQLIEIIYKSIGNCVFVLKNKPKDMEGGINFMGSRKRRERGLDTDGRTAAEIYSKQMESGGTSSSVKSANKTQSEKKGGRWEIFMCSFEL